MCVVSDLLLKRHFFNVGSMSNFATLEVFYHWRCHYVNSYFLVP